jgi:hypothetical protein
MKRVYRAVVAAALISAGGAWAVKVGDKLYIKAKGVKLLKEPKATAAPASPKELAVGDAVVWKGPSDKDKQFHQIEANGKSGFVLMSSLSPSQPQPELAEGTGKPMDAKAFASSGAATKALTPAAIKYANAKGKGPKITANEAASMVIYVEEHNKNTGTPEAIAAKSKDLGGSK